MKHPSVTDAQLSFPLLSSSRSTVQTCAFPLLHPQNLSGTPPRQTVLREVWLEGQLPSWEGWLLTHATAQTIVVLLWELGHLTHIPLAESLTVFGCLQYLAYLPERGKTYFFALIWKDLGHLNPWDFKIHETALPLETVPKMEVSPRGFVTAQPWLSCRTTSVYRQQAAEATTPFFIITALGTDYP